MDKELRPYQKAIVDKVLASDRDDIICLPTGAGKTVVANAIMEGLPGKCVFIVPRLELIAQAKSEFGDTDVVWSDKTEITGKKTIIASKDSLRVQLKKLDLDKNEHITLIFDEAHVSIKQTHSLVTAFKEKCGDIRVLGLTATPERMDGLALLKGDDQLHKYGVFDGVMQEETVASLISKNYLANLRYFAKPIEGITKIKPTNAAGEELTGDQMTKIMNDNNIWGDLVGCYEKYGAGRPAVGFTVTIDMADEVCRIFREAGYDFRVIHGGMGVPERKHLIDMLTNRQIHGLVNAALLTYGFDCPPVSYAFSVRHIKSRPLWFQMVGRILRLFDGKKDAVFIDHGDSISEFSEPANPLPILAAKMDWRADGETKEQKQIRKTSMKKAQQTMGIIQSLTNEDVDMVEITTENIYERLANLILKLQGENENLKKKMTSMASETALLKNVVNNTMETIHSQKAQLEHTQKALEEKKMELAQSKKTIDKDETFQYVRKNYCAYRRLAEREYPDDQAMQHKLVCKRIMADEARLNFYFDRITLQRGFEYWHKAYKPYVPEPQPETSADTPAPTAPAAD